MLFRTCICVRAPVVVASHLSIGGQMITEEPPGATAQEVLTMRKLALLAATLAAAAGLTAASAFAHNAGHVILPDGTCVNVGSGKDAPLVGQGAPQTVNGALDLEPNQGTHDTSDQYGTRYAADQGNSAILPGDCPAP